ncbi:MAG: helix-turn-helix domain-containing protein [Bacteroidales bacterium]|nr:helix-turn-helix domain-containing protein [Bacteroidales bacterium]
MKNRGGKSFILFLLGLLLSSAVSVSAPVSGSGFSGSHLSRFLSMEDGLPGNFIDDIHKDGSGFLWFATSGGGLCRYDGYSFLTFSTNTSVSIRNNFVHSLAEDPFNRLWIASEGGIDVLDLNTYRMCRFPALEEFEVISCSFVTADAQGSLWFKSASSLVRIGFDRRGEIASLSRFDDPRLAPAAFVCEDVDGDGSVWAALGGRICRIGPAADGTLQATPILDGLTLREDTYLSDFLLREKEVWMSTADGLYRYDLNAGAWKHYTHNPSDPSSLSQNFITGLAVSSDRRLITVSLKGMNIYNPISDSFERVGVDSPLLDSDFINCVQSYGEDIWLGTESAGAVQVFPKRLAAENVVHDPSDPSSLAANPVNALFEDASGRVWVGNVEAGLAYASSFSGPFHHLTVSDAGLSHDSVSALAEDADGRIWVGTWGGGVDVLQQDPPFRVQKRLVEPGAVNELSYVGALVHDRINGLMWIGTNAGIFYYDIEADRLCSALREQTNGCIGACIDSEGRLWMGGQTGVYVFDLDSRDTSASDCAFPVRNYRYKLDHPGSSTVEKIYAVCQGSDGTVWLGSYGNGLYRTVEGPDGSLSFRNYSVEDGLVNDNVKGILEDFAGDLWLATDNGLSRFSPGTGAFVSYGEADGLASGQFYLNASCRTSDGLLCFGHVDGLTLLDPAHTSGPQFVSNLHFSRISVGDDVMYASDGSRLKLHERDRSIAFEFSDLAFVPGSATRYASLLEGQDEEWVDVPAGQNALHFTSMQHGRHTLRVRSFDASGQPTGECSIPIRVIPYFYHSWLFYILMACLIAASVFAWQDWRMRSLVRQREELRVTVEERTREIREQKRLLEEKAEELDRQNKVLTRQNEELAGRRILSSQDARPAETRDGKFVAKAVATIREMYRDPDLDVTAFCTAMGMSKTLLNNRLQETLGQSIGQFIRTYRLSIAREILLNNRETRSMNISEIAYEVGFNDPKYFTRCFTKEYGTSPSTYPQD